MGLLRTDNSLEVATSLGVGAAAVHTFDVSQSASGEMIQLLRTSTSDTSPVAVILAGDTSTAQALGISVTGDSVNRYGVDPTGKITWGSGSASRDTNLYRSAVGVLKTDDTLTVGNGLDVTGRHRDLRPVPVRAELLRPGVADSAHRQQHHPGAVGFRRRLHEQLYRPASGKVLVAASFVAQPSASGIDVMLALAATGTVTPVIGNTITT